MSTITFDSKTTKRFLAKFTFGNKDQCWEWIASKFSDGYGSFRYQGKSVKANRVAWMFFKGQISSGLCVLHTCDNPACVNPNHLWLGTQSENIQDMKRKERQPKGINRPSAKLDDSQVQEIRHLYAQGGYSHRGLAKMYGVSSTVVHHIIHHNKWK